MAGMVVAIPVARGETRRLEHTSFEIIALKVLEYLNENPDAQDTLEGITAWWLPQVDIQYKSSEISHVLKELTAKGVLIEYEQGGASTYQINNTRKREISSLLHLLKREDN